MNPSVISIKLGGVEISDRVLYSQTSFESGANPMQGSFTVVCKDPDQDFSPQNGQRLQLTIDDKPMFGGYVMEISRELMFTVDDTTYPENVKTRKWVLTGPDYNVLFDKRVVRDPTDYKSTIAVPANKRQLKDAIRYFCDNYIDTPSGLGYDIDEDMTEPYGDPAVDRVIYVQQSSTWRDQMEDFSDYNAIVYYIDGSFTLCVNQYARMLMSWLFVDSHPDGIKTVGFREGSYNSSASPMVTDALVWGGSSLANPGEDLETSEGIGVVFARYPTGPIEDQVVQGKTQKQQTEQDAVDRMALYGRWQQAEFNVGQENYLTQGSVKNRAYVMVAGATGRPPTWGVEGGWNKPIETVKLAWFAHDVPNGDHVLPGFMSDFIFYTQEGDAGNVLYKRFPLRSMRITFPTLPADNPDGDPLTYVRFDGTFGTNYSDSRHLWKYLKKSDRNRRRRAQRIISVVTGDSVPGAAQAQAKSLMPIESPDGDRTHFTFTYTFWVNSADVYLNGLLQTSGSHYYWTQDPQELVFWTSPSATDRIHVYGTVSSGGI
jgi:hypothetical protein